MVAEWPSSHARPPAPIFVQHKLLPRVKNADVHAVVCSALLACAAIAHVRESYATFRSWQCAFAKKETWCMSIIFEARASDSPYVESVARGGTAADGITIRPAEYPWHLFLRGRMASSTP